MRLGMKLALIALVLLPSIALAGPKNTKVKVMSHRETHCGGAALPPGEPMYEDSIGAQMTFLIRKGKTNTASKVIATVTSDKTGVFSVDLPKGTYCVITPDKKNVPSSKNAVLAAPAKSSSNVDQGCLDGLKLQCDGVIVAPTTKGQVDLYTSGCFPPCYRGPMPP